MELYVGYGRLTKTPTGVFVVLYGIIENKSNQGGIMMAIETLRKVDVKVKLNNGTDAQGKAKYANISLGDLSEENYDADDALEVVTALAPCLSKTVSMVNQTKESSLTAA